MTTPATRTVTFVFTDIDGSTRLLQAHGPRYAELLADHHRLLRTSFKEQNGTEVETAGDSLYYTFPSARAAILATVDAQRALLGHAWPDGAAVRVRMGLHTGEPLSGEGGYIGLDVHRASRICSAGHGGQILLSQTTRDLAGADLPTEIALRDLGDHWLKDLAVAERLFQVVAPDLPVDFPPLRSIDARPNNLPLQLTSFVGRHEAVGEAKRILASAPLLTLTGPGGVGKTRLALEVAADLMNDLEGGAWFVELGSLTDPAFVLQAVAAALGVSEQPGRQLLTTVIEHLQASRLLLVLDNCEHLLEACAETADALLRGCPSVRMIATSREPLGISGEALFPVPSLTLPAVGQRPLSEELMSYEAVRLFAERAMAASPAFRITDQNAPSIVQICRRLDGVPLALELAAARVRALAVDQIATRLDDRFRLLTGSSRIGVPRHQTLRATIDWSFELLAEEERAVLRRLSVFAGSCTLEAAEGVCALEPVGDADVLDLLSHLVDKSLVAADPFGSEGRYRLLETIRQYARDRLLESGEAEAVLRRHRDWYLALVEQAAPEFFRGPESGSWLERLDREHDNLRVALQWSEDQPGETGAGLRLAAALWRFWEIRGHLIEGRAWLERMLAATATEVSPLRANALTGAGVLASMHGDHAAATAFHEESLALHRQLGDPRSIAFAINNLANAAAAQADFARASELYEQSAIIARQMKDERAVAFSLINQADVVARKGDAPRARLLFEESVATFREFGDRWGEAFALDSFALVAARERDYEAAQSLHEEALAISRQLGDERGAARVLTHLADVASKQGDDSRARRLSRECLDIRQALGDTPGTASALERLAWVVMADEPEAAARLVGAAEALRETIRAFVPPQARADREVHLRALEERLDGDRMQTALGQGRLMSPEEALATLPP
jgi:predicted ATPase/class 3 adenylate cyclase